MKSSYLKYLLHAAVVIGLIAAGIKYLSGDGVLEALYQFNYGFAPLLLLLSAGYMLLKAWRFVLLLRPLEEDLAWSPVFRAYLAGQGAAFIPGGIAARIGLLKQANVSPGKGGIPVTFSSGLDQVVLICGALIAAWWFGKGQFSVLIIVGVIIAFVLALIIPMTRSQLSRAACWLAEKFKMQKQWEEFLESVPEVVTWPTMSATLALTIVAFTFHIIMLGMAIEGVGFSISYPILALAYILPTVLGRLSGLPGGVGVTEAGMVGFLTSTSELDSGTAFAAVAIFRIASIVFIALIGAVVYFLGWWGEQETATATLS